MREVAGTRRWLALVITMLTLVSAHAATRSLGVLIDTVINKGPDSQLPAHLSVVLGVSRTERATPVKQAVMRDGATVRTFNVSTAKHDEVVLINYNKLSHSSNAYRVSRTGELRKAVSYQAGAPAVERLLSEARDDFAIEITFWLDFASQPGGA